MQDKQSQSSIFALMGAFGSSEYVRCSQRICSICST